MRTYVSIFVLGLLLVAGAVFSQGQDAIRFAVSPFISLTVDAEKENAGKEASHEIEEGLAKGKWFELRKSGEIESFLSKLEFAQAGGGNVDEVASMGKSLQIKYLTVGSVAKFGSHYEVDSRSVNIDNWTIVHSSGCSSADLDGACDFINKDVSITLTKEDLAAGETYFPDGMTPPRFYQPTTRGVEERIARRLQDLTERNTRGSVVSTSGTESDSAAAPPPSD